MLTFSKNHLRRERKDYQIRKFMLETVFLVLLCITELMVPCLGATCGVTDGSEANNVACTCGSVECTRTTGLICYSNGGGSCRKTGFGSFGYPKEKGDKMCVDVSNRQSILDIASCEAAAVSMGLDDVKVKIKRGGGPPGCYWKGSNLYYNMEYTYLPSCTYQSDFCLCITLPDCTQTNGAMSNTGTCFCGGTRCTAASGLFCYAEGSKCSLVTIPVCGTTDGSVANGADCTCGVTECTAASGLFCYASNSQCSLGAIPDCLATNGSVANGAACTCSSETCTSTTGLICYSNGGGSCRKTGFGRFGYVKVEGRTDVSNRLSGLCVDVSNRKSILDKASCEGAATSMDLDVVVAYEMSESNRPPGCFWDRKSLYYNTVSTSTESCAGSNFIQEGFCLCIAAPNCTHISGATLNTAPCLCGETGCTAASGLFCESAGFDPDAGFSNGQCATVSRASNLIGLWIGLGIGLPVLFIVVFVCCFKRLLESVMEENGSSNSGTSTISNPKKLMNPLQVLDASAELEAIFARDRTGDGDEERAKELEEILKQFTPIPVSPATSAVSSIEMGAPVKKNEISEESNGQWSVHVE